MNCLRHELHLRCMNCALGALRMIWKNVDGSKSGYYTVTYTNETGCKSVTKIKIVVDDPQKPFIEDTITTSIADRRMRESKDMRLNRTPVYFDLLGNRLKGKPRNGMFVVR